jgi:hypothetical protein
LESFSPEERKEVFGLFCPECGKHKLVCIGHLKPVKSIDFQYTGIVNGVRKYRVSFSFPDMSPISGTLDEVLEELSNAQMIGKKWTRGEWLCALDSESAVGWFIKTDEARRRSNA